jgi:hypothetical protein
MMEKDPLENSWTPDKDALMRAYQKHAEEANRKARGVTGMEAVPTKFDLGEWMPIIRKLVWLFLAALGSFGAGSIERSTSGELKAAESTAGEAIRAEDNWQATYDALQYYVARESGCNAALEAFSRHRDDNIDWLLVVSKCHSDGELPEAVPGVSD